MSYLYNLSTLKTLGLGAVGTCPAQPKDNQSADLTIYVSCVGFGSSTFLYIMLLYYSLTVRMISKAYKTSVLPFVKQFSNQTKLPPYPNGITSVGINRTILVCFYVYPGRH